MKNQKKIIYKYEPFIKLYKENFKNIIFDFLQIYKNSWKLVNIFNDFFLLQNEEKIHETLFTFILTIF